MMSLPTVNAQPAAGVPTVYGSLIFADGWASWEDAPYGIYKFPASWDAEISLVKKGRNLMANGAGTYIDGKYYMIGYRSDDFGNMGDISFRVFDADAGWKLLREVSLDYLENLPTDLTYDPVTDKVYGCFWGSESFTFATLNLLTGQPQTIAPLSEQLVGLAADGTGGFYAIDVNGKVSRLAVKDGAVTLDEIGDTGLDVRYAQSATFDHASGSLLWSAAMLDSTAPGGLYEVDTTDGSSRLITDYPDGYEITGIYTTAPFAAGGAPCAVADPAFDAVGTSLAGNITFTLPATDMAGGALAGELAYDVCIDDNAATAYSGKATPDSRVSIPFSFSKAATHMARVSAVNDAGRGPVRTLYKWIGADKAQAVNPVMKQTSTGLSVSWDAPSEGVNGGYIDTSALTYRVLRQPKGVQVYEGPATSFSEDITITDLMYYWYDVIAVAGGEAGVPASSNKMKLGTSCPMPYNVNFNSEDDFDWFTVEDVNRDGHSWLPYENSAVYEFDLDNDADDWLITPPLAFDPECAYLLKAKIKAGNSFLPEKMRIAAGLSPDAEAMDVTLASFDNIDWTDFREVSAVVIPSSDAPAYIGFKACSDANSALLYLDDISVDAVASVHGPDCVTELKASTVGEGASSVSLSFRLPLKTLDGEKAAAVNCVEVRRNGQFVKEFDSGLADGSECSFTDENPPAGHNTYDVVPYNADGSGMSATIAVFVGEDVPAKAENIKLEDLGNGDMRLTWDAPSKGINGGYVDPAALQYEVAFAGGAYGPGEYVSETTYMGHVDLEQGKQRLAWYEITPMSQLGIGETASSEMCFLGDAYPLPFKESFSRMSLDKGPWNTVSDGIAKWRLVGVAEADAQDYDGGLMLFSPLITGGNAQLVSPKITLAGSDNPVLSFWVWHNKQADNRLQVVLLDAAGREHMLMEIDQNRVESEDCDAVWVEHRVALADYCKLGDVQLMFNAVNRKYVFMQENTLWLDNITIRNIFDNDLEISELFGNGPVKVGETITFRASVKNCGAVDADGYTVELYRNDKLVDAVKGKPLSPDASAVVELSDTPNADASQTSMYHAVVNYAADQKRDNNRTEDVAVTVLPGLPFIDTLAGETDGSVTRLSWTAPWTDGDTEAAGEVTDDFESYAPFAIKDVGLWTMIDGDGSRTGGIIGNDGNYVDYPNVEAPKAFIVFNPSEAGLASSRWSAHSGNQTLASFLTTARYNDDWLVSPELDGSAQTMKFWAAAPDCAWFGTKETVQVLYSTGGTNVEDFKQIGSDIIVGSEQWKQYSVSLPEGAKRFAIRCVSRDQYILYIDDVTYCPAVDRLMLTGYNVYRDGSLLEGIPQTTTCYTDNAPQGDHRYTVTAVYDRGESRHSNVYDTSTAGIDDSRVAEVIVSAATPGYITVSGAEGLRVSVISVSGGVVWSGTGDAAIALPSGVYVVKAGAKTMKLRVK